MGYSLKFREKSSIARVLLLTTVMAFAGLLTFSYYFQPGSRIIGNRMAPAAAEGDIVSTETPHNLQRYDLVLFNINNGLRISRIIGMPSDVVEIKYGQTFVNSKPLIESYLPTFPTIQDATFYVASDEYFVMLDHRKSEDTMWLVKQYDINKRINHVYHLGKVKSISDLKIYEIIKVLFGSAILFMFIFVPLFIYYYTPKKLIDILICLPNTIIAVSIVLFILFIGFQYKSYSEVIIKYFLIASTNFFIIISVGIKQPLFQLALAFFVSLWAIMMVKLKHTREDQLECKEAHIEREQTKSEEVQAQQEWEKICHDRWTGWRSGDAEGPNRSEASDRESAGTPPS